MTEIHEFTIGQLKCTIINDGFITIRPTSAFFEGASESELSENLAEYDIPADGMTIPCSILLVEKGDSRILVDCGSGGELAGYDADLGHLFAGLEEINISPDDITHVILSHGHFDHISGCADNEGNPRFANASYIMAKEEFDYWIGESGAYKIRSKLLAIQSQLQLTDTTAEILEGVRLIATPGHTLHHISVEFESDGEILLCPIDVMDHQLQGKNPTWGADWDLDRTASIESRRKILQRASDSQALVQGFHFPFPGLGRFSFDGDVWQWETES